MLGRNKLAAYQPPTQTNSFSHQPLLAPASPPPTAPDNVMLARPVRALPALMDGANAMLPL